MQPQNKFIELEDMCDKAFKRNSIYPLMEVPKPDSKDTIEEQYKMQVEIYSQLIKNNYNKKEVQRIFKQENEV